MLPSVLIVDDEQSIIDIVKMTLELKGHSVETASDGASALRLLAANDYDVVITDLRMPGIGGIDIFQYCTEKHPGLVNRFLILTGDSLSLDTRQFIETTQIPFLLKPFDLKTLIDAVEHLIDRG